VQAAKAMSRASGRLGRELKTLRDENKRLQEQLAQQGPDSHRQTTDTAGEATSMVAPPEGGFSVESFGDDQTIETLNAMHRQLTELRDRLAAMESDREEREAETVQREADAFFSDLDPEVFARYHTEAEAQENREELVAMALGIKEAQEELLGRPMELNQALHAALAALCPEEIEAQRERDLQARIKGRRKQFSARPSQTARRSETRPRTKEEKDAAILAAFREMHPEYGR